MIRPPRFVPDSVDAGMSRIRQQAQPHPVKAPANQTPADSTTAQAARLRALLDALTPPETSSGSPPEAQAQRFGEPFLLTSLPLPRPACGYGVHLLGSDRLLDQRSLTFQPIRHPGITACFPRFDAAEQIAGQWQDKNPTLHDWPVSIVPLGWDADMQRPILLWGMLSAEPEAALDAERATLRSILAAALVAIVPASHNVPAKSHQKSR